MSEVTVLLTAIEQGDTHAAEQLLPLVYDELRRLAASRIGRERTPMRRVRRLSISDFSRPPSWL
ncbi:MAG: ECF-type sigma factor [Planctomycetales bacterium]|nr:ECF-type sigma factor [Planctomycetales bacterium]